MDNLYAAPLRLRRTWMRLCDQYLPITEENSIWRFSRTPTDRSPQQGWKLHVSATSLTACTMLQRIAPYLNHKKVLFKAPVSLEEVHNLNSGLRYSYTQIGKLVTVYPQSPKEAATIARTLHRLTYNMRAPSVPFDFVVGKDSCVYYRYGAFQSLTIENPNGTQSPALRDPTGKLVPDLRNTPKPPWIKKTLFKEVEFEDDREDHPLKTTYRVIRALSQRGKGGVYQAVDLSTGVPRACVIKEGRNLGELSWDGRDGAKRVRHEEVVLKSLSSAGVPVPKFFSSFSVQQNRYLVTEYLQGETLMAFLLKKKRRLGLAEALRLATKVASLLAEIHATGWTWRDCKPANLIMDRTGAIRPIDFEGACRTDKPDSMPWGTSGFTPPVWKRDVKTRQFEDLYALGATLYFFFTGRLLEGPNSPPIDQLRRNIPKSLCLLVSELLSGDPDTQLSAARLTKRLVALASEIER